MQNLIESFKHATGKTLKTVKVDQKSGTLTLEFEGTDLTNKIQLAVKQNSFIGFEAKPRTRSAKETKIKAVEKALAPIVPTPSKPERGSILKKKKSVKKADKTATSDIKQNL